MEIKTKFNINDLVHYKFQRTDNEKIQSFFEIQYIHTEVCSAGAQVFYLCRPIHISYDKNFTGGQKIWLPDDFELLKPKEGDYQKLREDELIPVSEKVLAIMKQFNMNPK